MKMADSPEEEKSSHVTNGSLNTDIPIILPDLESEKEDSKLSPETKLPSECDLSLSQKLNSKSSSHSTSTSALPFSPAPVLKKQQRPNVDKPFTASDRLSAPLNKPIPQDLNNKKLQINTGSATGNPRNKCALAPGHSLMDWIRLGNSGKDLTGVGGRIQPVSPKELAAHNTQTDAWLAIRGRVYNITHYLSFHPGGPEELMRGAGLDATQLFDKVHPWVNYDSLLAKCLIGPLRIDMPDVEELFGPSSPSPKSDRLREPSKAQELVRKSMENLANCITPVRKKAITKNEDRASPPSKIMQCLIQSSDLPVSISRRAASSPSKSQNKNADEAPPMLRFDWIQTSTKLTLSIYTGALSNPGACVRLTDGNLLIEVVTNGWLRRLMLVPEAKLKEELQIKIYPDSGKLEVIALKAEAGVWQVCGKVTPSQALRTTTPGTVQCLVVETGRVSHDTVTLTLAADGPVIVPLGYHLRVHHTVNGSDCVRSYTPVGAGWGPPSSFSDSGTFRLAVKRYDTGALSPYLTSLQSGDSVTISGPYGNFQLHKLKAVNTIFFIAAGTGITPMLGLIKYMLSRSNPRCDRIHLLFFNKTEEDILFRENFDQIAEQDNRFVSTHILSDCGQSWAGHSGRISEDLLCQVAIKDKLVCGDTCTHFACLCGPTEFTHAGLELLNKLGMQEQCIHAFMG